MDNKKLESPQNMKYNASRWVCRGICYVFVGLGNVSSKVLSPCVARRPGWRSALGSVVAVCAMVGECFGSDQTVVLMENAVIQIPAAAPQLRKSEKSFFSSVHSTAGALFHFCVRNKEPMAIIAFTGLAVYAAVKILSEDVEDQPTEQTLPQRNDPQLQELQNLADQQSAFGQQLQQLSGAITALTTSYQTARRQDSAQLQELRSMLQHLTTVVQSLQAPSSQQNIAQINQFNILNPPSNTVDRTDEFDQRITGLSGDIGDILQRLRQMNQKIQELEAKVIQDEITQGIVIARQDAAHRIQLCHQEMLNLLEKRIEDLKVENE